MRNTWSGNIELVHDFAEGIDLGEVESVVGDVT